MKKSKKRKKIKRNKNRVIYINTKNILEELIDIDRNIAIKKIFGICPLDLLNFILKYPNTKI